MTCAACEGQWPERCGECHGTGKATVTSCPRLQLDRDAAEMVFAAMHAEKGLWPVRGGMLDQTESALVAIPFVWNEQRRMNGKTES